MVQRGWRVGSRTIYTTAGALVTCLSAPEGALTCFVVARCCSMCALSPSRHSLRCLSASPWSGGGDWGVRGDSYEPAGHEDMTIVEMLQGHPSDV